MLASQEQPAARNRVDPALPPNASSDLTNNGKKDDVIKAPEDEPAKV
jgi:hypothetical protein